ncbi:MULTISPECIES: NmrA family NAD(P)-binding protein [unclassified Modestobacter]|uniref:NmrA family NAD(P)-binding protein n=1 Tax=unclassified Modestobacter TaxID=2643866 RepID=UPI0022AAD5A7|nr:MULTISPECIES: NAD(P)H-binding protein [unclassified Modestobacter]MCZ2811938.1 NAD(P)H-binding protein [Modestobacter sp. VKM Ac-2979]MCZ2843661.1 NAD(P)H-binding protein [Modestobacter sp. VKM Ac-2980]MCZ2850837.1 NAD(P)H-binding protein [Modestobacter sp. VKM Ac-2978]
MSDTTVLVLGATGKAGRRITPRLRMRGLTVRAASRTSPTPFDWSNPGGWDAALRGADAVYVVPPAVPGPVHQLVARAIATGVQRLVLQSGHGADVWGDTAFGRDMLSAEDAVRASNLEWTVLRAANFNQNFDEELWHAPLVQGELALPAGSVPEPFIDLEDVADVATAVLMEPGRHDGRIYELTGPRALTFAEAVEVVSVASGLPMTYRQISPQEYTDALTQGGLPLEVAHHVSEMFVMMARGVIAQTTEDVSAVLGRSPRSFEEYAVRAAASGAWRR